MDKLKPVLEQKFWILLGLAIILPIIAWWSMSNEVSAEIASRRNQIDKSFTEVPADAKSKPNEAWTKSLTAMNEQRKVYIAEQAKKLWESQKDLYRFPPDVEKFRGPFRGKFTNLQGRDHYRHQYDAEINQLRQIVDPLQANGKGVVYVPETVIPRVPAGRWESAMPNDAEVWDAQEDIWLLTAIFNAIKETNAGKQTIGEAAIREIVSLRLRGGSRADITSLMQGKPAANAVDAPPKQPKKKKSFKDDEPEEAAVKEMLDDEISGSRGSRGGMPSSMSFDLNEVFGGGDGQADMSTNTPAESAGSGGLDLAMGRDKDSKAKSKAGAPRYIDQENPNQNSVSMGFFIYVIMDHRELPEFLSKLSSSRFPCEISRVHMTKFSFENRAPNFPEKESEAAVAPAPGQRAVKQVNAGVEAYQRAMNDPALASVAVAGILTMYRPPAAAAGTATADAGKAPDKAAPASPEPNKGAAPAATPATKAPAAAAPPAEKKTPEAPATNGKAAAPPATKPAEPSKAEPKASPKAETGAAPATPPAKPAEPPKQGTSPPPGAPAQPAAGSGR